MKIDNYNDRILKLYNASNKEVTFYNFCISIDFFKDHLKRNPPLGLCCLCKNNGNICLCGSNLSCLNNKIEILKKYKVL